MQVLQLGGSSPELLGKAAAICYDRGYREFNLNIGCPSEKGQSVCNYGAVLMGDPWLVGECMRQVGAIPSLPLYFGATVGEIVFGPCQGRECRSTAHFDFFSISLLPRCVCAAILHQPVDPRMSMNEIQIGNAVPMDVPCTVKCRIGIGATEKYVQYSTADASPDSVFFKVE